MYLKPTVSNAPLDLSSSARLKDVNFTPLRNSLLVCRDRDGSDFQFFDIRVPFLLVYESVDVSIDQTTYMEFSEQGNFRVNSLYSDYCKIPRRSHTHDFYEVTYVLSGKLTLQIEDEEVIYGPGECCVCNKNIHHLEVMDADTELVLLMLKDSFVRDLLRDAPNDTETNDTVFGRLFSENRRTPLYDAKVYADFRCPDQTLRDTFLKLINGLTAELMGDHLGKSYMVRALLCRFLELLEQTPGYHSEIHSAKLSREEQLVSIIARAYRSRMDIMTRREVEQLTGYRSDHVERAIKRQTGMTLSEYGRQFLLQHAAELLRGTNKTIGEICEALGYSNRTYFNQIFKARFGMTPVQFRQLHRGENNVSSVSE